MKSTLITGATGFLGKHLVELLKQSPNPGPEGGSRLRVFCRGTSPWDNDPAVEVCRGDVTSAKDVMGAAEGVTEIYHLAGLVSRSPKDAEMLYRTHVDGTRNVCEAVRKHGVQKMVHVSSSGTIAVGREAVEHEEQSSYKYEIVGQWPYYLSKIYAEKVVFSYVKQYQLPAVVVNPSLLLGPGDDRRSSTGDVALFLNGQIMAIPLGGLNFLDVRDAAKGAVAAMRSGRVGERYLLGGRNWNFKVFIQRLSEISGVPAPKMQPSLKMSLASARILRWLLPLVGRSFALDDVAIKMSALYWYCDCSKARSQLGFETRDPMETLRDTVANLSGNVLSGITPGSARATSP